MSEVYSQEYHVRWSDLDPNQHMRHSAYADLCAATRISYLESFGFGMSAFAKLKMGPVLFNENIHYFSEVRPNDKVIVNVRVSGVSESGHKWTMHHEIFRKSDNKLAATIDIAGAWFDLSQRKVSAPPQELREKIDLVPRTNDFKIL